MFAPNGTMILALDNTNITGGGAISQSFANLTLTGPGKPDASTQQHHRRQSLPASSPAPFTRPAGAELLINAGATPSATSQSHRHQLRRGHSNINVGVFYNGTDYRRPRPERSQWIPAARSTTARTPISPRRTSSAGPHDAGQCRRRTGGVTATAPPARIRKSPAVSLNQATAQISSLVLGSGASLTLGTGSTLTDVSMGLIKSGGGTATISGGTALQLGTAAGEAVIRSNAVGDNLQINTPITFSGTTGNTFTKVGNGTLTLGAAEAFTATIVVDQGTLTPSEQHRARRDRQRGHYLQWRGLESRWRGRRGGGITVSQQFRQLWVSPVSTRLVFKTRPPARSATFPVTIP